MNNNCAVSVVMPVYNAENYLSLAIESLLSQTLENFELILIDDGSTDDSVVIADSYKDPRIVRINQGVNKGNFAARNRGLRIARGRYICVMDADDIAYPHRLQTQVDYLNKHPLVGLIGALADRIDEDGSIIGVMPRPLTFTDIRLFLLKENCFIHPTIMVRAQCLKKQYIRYNEEYVYAGDYDFVSRCARRFTVENLREKLIQYRVHKTQISQTKKAQQVSYADKIRLKQIIQFDLKVDIKEQHAHLTMMRGEIKNEEELKVCFRWCQRLSDRNSRLRRYPPEQFDDFLLYVLSQCARSLS
ncbi:MAG TPA: glycosyltransferase [Puia sp.]|nr:glycosyltransferase [Puia sp.]